jgi:preprotein translocase subunit SecY
VYLAAVCVMPFFIQDYLGVNFYFGGISLVICVSVGLDTVNQIENHLITRHYDDFKKGSGGRSAADSEIKGRRGGGGGGGIAGRDDS